MTEEIKAEGTEEEVKVDTPVEGEEADEQKDPVKQELEKVKSRKISKKDRLIFQRKKIDEQLAEEGEDGDPVIPADDSEPMTVGKYNELKKVEAKKTAMELAEDITDESERELTKHYLEDRIVPSGNSEADLSLARGMVNAVKNSQVVEEIKRGTKPVISGGNAPGSPARKSNGVFEPTAEEQVFMQPPYNLSEDQIKKARKEAEANQS